MDFLAIILAILSITGAILNVLKVKWGFILWIVSNIGWVVVDWYTKFYEQIPVWIVYTIISGWGFWSWSKVKVGDEK
jgi:nicotinamide riboside transporter PnuC